MNIIDMCRGICGHDVIEGCTLRVFVTLFET